MWQGLGALTAWTTNTQPFPPGPQGLITVSILHCPTKLCFVSSLRQWFSIWVIICFIRYCQLLESRKYFATNIKVPNVCVFLKYCGYFHSNFILLLCYISQVSLIGKDNNLTQTSIGQKGDLLQNYWILNMLLSCNILSTNLVTSNNHIIMLMN